MTFLNEILEKLSGFISDDIKSLDIEESVKVGSIKPEKLAKKKIKRALFSLDLTPDVVFHAIDNQIDIIFIHQAFQIWSESKVQDETISLMQVLIEKNIYVFFFQGNSLINSKLNDYLVEILNAEVDSTLSIKTTGKNLPVGRIARFANNKIPFESLLDIVSEKLDLDNVRYYSTSKDIEIETFLILAGHLSNHEIIKTANAMDIKLILGEGLNYEILHYCQFYEMSFIDITRFGLAKAFMHLASLLKMKFVDVEFDFYKKDFLFSIYQKREK